jgi:hypothetical protein
LQRKLAAKQEAVDKKALLVQRMESTRTVSSGSGGGRRGTLLARAETIRLKRVAQKLIEDEQFLAELSFDDRSKLLELRKKRDEASLVRRYIYNWLVKEKEESLHKKLAGPVAAPLWNSYLGYVLSILYVAFMSFYIVLVRILVGVELPHFL